MAAFTQKNLCWRGRLPNKIQNHEHKRALKNNDLSNRLTLLRNTFNHNFNFANTKILKNSHDLKKRRCIESAAILNYNTITQRCGHFNLNKQLSLNILKQYNIDKLKLNQNTPIQDFTHPP